MSCTQFSEQEIRQSAAEADSFGEDFNVKSGWPSGSGTERSPTRLWKHHKPHRATINDLTVSHNIEFHSGDNWVCVGAYFSSHSFEELSSCAFCVACCAYGCCFSIPERKWGNVGCSPSACVWTQDCFPPPSSNVDRRRNAHGTEDKKKRMINDSVKRKRLHLKFCAFYTWGSV